MNTIIVNFNGFVLGASVTYMKDNDVMSKTNIANLTGEEIGAIASKSNADKVIVRGPKEFVLKIKEQMLTNYSNLNVEFMEF